MLPNRAKSTSVIDFLNKVWYNVSICSLEGHRTLYWGIFTEEDEIPMKKLVAIILTVVLVLSVSITAFAADGIRGRKPGWWYDVGDPNGTYFFDEKEQKEIQLSFAEAMTAAEGLMSLNYLVETLQQNGMSLMNYEIYREKSANYVFYIEAVNRQGQIWSCYFSTYTHDGMGDVMNDLQYGVIPKYYVIFLTTYVDGQAIKKYAPEEKITGFDLSLRDAVGQFINILNNYDYYYSIYYGGDNCEPEYDWDDDWYDGNG